jgi:hypothetical protein
MTTVNDMQDAVVERHQTSHARASAVGGALGESEWQRGRLSRQTQFPCYGRKELGLGREIRIAPVAQRTFVRGRLDRV